MEATREGKRFILASCLIALAALNTGNNLIYLILSLMLSILFLSVALLRLNLSRLTMRLHVPQAVFAGDKAVASLMIENHKEHIPTFSLRVSADHHLLTLLPADCGYIPARSSCEIRQEAMFRRRGFYRSPELIVRSGFPFIFFVRKARYSASAGIMVYPALRDVADLVRCFPSDTACPAARSAGRGEDLHSLREYRHGDDMREIHWKASAKTGLLMVKEYAAHDSRKLTVVIDNCSSGTSGYHRDGEDDLDNHFEKAVSLTASLASHFLEEGYAVRLFSCDKKVPFGSGMEHLFTILDALAVMAENGEWEGGERADEGGLWVTVARRRGRQLPPFVPGTDLVLYAEDL